MCCSPIAIIDSGIGGIEVARALRKRLPGETILYFGDTARAPYGSKSAQTVKAFVSQMIDYLRGYDPKHVILACHTAAAVALPAMRGEFADLSITGVVEPCARLAIEAAGAKQFPLIGIVASEATIASKAYERAIHRRRHHARLLLRATPLVVPLVDEGRGEKDPILKLALQQYLHPMAVRGPDVLVLGSSHLSAVKKLIARIMGQKVKLIDAAEACAEDVARRLAERKLLSDAHDAGSLRWFLSDDSPRWRALAAKFLGDQIEPPVLVDGDDLHALGRRRTSASCN